MNHRIDRRRFVLSVASSLAAATLPGAVRAAMGPNDKFDLVIRGGEVLDPSQQLRAGRPCVTTLERARSIQRLTSGRSGNSSPAQALRVTTTCSASTVPLAVVTAQPRPPASGVTARTCVPKAKRAPRLAAAWAVP